VCVLVVLIFVSPLFFPSFVLSYFWPTFFSDIQFHNFYTLFILAILSVCFLNQHKWLHDCLISIKSFKISTLWQQGSGLKGRGNTQTTPKWNHHPVISKESLAITGKQRLAVLLKIEDLLNFFVFKCQLMVKLVSNYIVGNFFGEFLNKELGDIDESAK